MTCFMQKVSSNNQSVLTSQLNSIINTVSFIPAQNPAVHHELYQVAFSSRAGILFLFFFIKEDVLSISTDIYVCSLSNWYVKIVFRM